MKIYLVQHGISAAENDGGEKVLTEKGRKETDLIASVARGYNVNVKEILHSGKARAEQTAEIYRNVLGVAHPLKDVAGIKPLDDVEKFSMKIANYKDCLIVGHLPFLERLISFLTTDKSDMKVYQFQNSGMVCIEAKEDGTGVEGGLNWYILWTLNPQIG